MKTYSVTFSFGGGVELFVRADDEESAKEIARDLFYGFSDERLGANVSYCELEKIIEEEDEA